MQKHLLYKLKPDTELHKENKVFRQAVKDYDPSIKVESYWTFTEDGFYLKVFRLVKDISSSSATSTKKPPLLL